jgi:excinuclease ABC subunit C
MFAGEARTIEVAGDLSALDAAIEAATAGSGVFAIWAAEGEPHIGRTSVLRRRLKRLLAPRERESRLLNLRAVVRRVEYWPVGSRLELSLVYYELARRYFPDRYLRLLKLRPPAYVKLVLANDYPRTQITTRITPGAGLYYGPFRTRAGAEEFEHGFLDLFQLRRCQEDLVPAADHPGCIYGEMNMCLRPCQQIVGIEEYASEVARVSDFLSTRGKHLLETAEHARERLSTELQFEEAARWHKRIDRINEVLKLREDIAGDIDRLNGVVVLPACEEQVVSLLFFLGGCFQPPQRFAVVPNADRSVSMDHRLRDLVSAMHPVKLSSREREEHLALFARWFFSTWRDGVWISFENLDMIPWRKVVSAISRTAAAVHSTKL